MSRFSFSRTALALECTAWLDPALPVDESTSAAASGGTTVGAIADAIVKGNPYTMPEDAQLRTFAEHVRAWLDSHRVVGLRSEIAFAWDHATGAGRELPSDGHRDYSAAKPTEACGTVDLIRMGQDDEGAFVWIGDWKYHFSPHRVDAEAQMTSLALAACRAYGVDRAIVVGLHVDERGVDDTSDVTTLDVFSLAEHAERLKGILTSPPSEPNDGPHCKDRYCPALASCPKTTAIVAQIVPVDSLVRREWAFVPVIESPDHLERLLAMLPIATEFIDRVKRATVAYVADGPVTTSSGAKIAQAFRTMTRTNQGALLELAKHLGATDEQLAMCARTAQEPNGVRVTGGAKKAKRAA